MRRRSASARRTGSAFELPDEREATRLGQILEAREVLSIDPGTRHCGMAWFHQRWHPEERLHTWALDRIEDLGPMECCSATRRWVEAEVRGVLVVEAFRLYPNKMVEQGLSAMGTPEVIGALKWIYLDSSVPWSGAADPSPWSKILVEQSASVKAAGRRYMARMGIEEVGSNQHKRDAEAHGWWRVHKLVGD